MPKLEVSDAQVRAVVTKAVDFTNQGLALLYKLGTAQDPKQTAQVRCLVGGAGRVVRQRAGAAWNVRVRQGPQLTACPTTPGCRCPVLGSEGRQLVLIHHARVPECVARALCAAVTPRERN